MIRDYKERNQPSLSGGVQESLLQMIPAMPKQASEILQLMRNKRRLSMGLEESTREIMNLKRCFAIKKEIKNFYNLLQHGGSDKELASFWHFIITEITLLIDGDQQDELNKIDERLPSRE